MSASCLLLTGVFDGPLMGGTPKGVELSATCAIPDLSRYGLGSANNGGGSTGVEFNFGAGSLSAGAFVYVSSEADKFEEFFGFAPSATSGAANVNGDDALELFLDGAVVDTFGEISADGTNSPWEYSDGWASRRSGTGPDGATFQRASWAFSGASALDSAATNAAAASPMPIGQYSLLASPSPSPPPVDATVILGPSGNGCPPRAQLRQQLVGHRSFPYTSSRTDTWDVLKEADADPAAAANVWLLYADRSTNGAQEYNSGAGWTREHLWPQSLARYEASSNDEPATDLHALRAALQSCNSHRSNHVFGAVPHTDWAPSHTDCPLLMCESGVCEPHDTIKGEIARALMYMALRYDGADDVSASSGAEDWLDLRLADVSNGGEALLASWSDAHAPGAAEIARDAIIASRQGFGNPFVTDPTLTRCRYEQGSLPAMPPSPLPPSSLPSSGSTRAKTSFMSARFSAAAIAFTAASTLWWFPR